MKNKIVVLKKGYNWKVRLYIKYKFDNRIMVDIVEIDKIGRMGGLKSKLDCLGIEWFRGKGVSIL
jgi:hypothetical protein